MDSVTQAVLGAAVGQTLIGRQVGKLAPIWGAVLGTLPDLDVLIPFGGAVEDFTYHRGFSHSLFIHLLLVPLLLFLILKCHPSTQEHKQRWAVTILAILWTHALLDTFTVYGTQLLWPFTEYPFGISSVFIIDPIYTLLLITGLILAARSGWSSLEARRPMVLAMTLSTLYLAWGVAAKTWINHRVDQAIAETGLEVRGILSTPTPFNTLLWRIILVSPDDHYHIGYFAVWDDPESLDLKTYPKGDGLLLELQDHWDVERLQWFTKGFYRTHIRDDKVVMTDLRMGVEGSYVFNFAIGQLEPGADVSAIKAEAVSDPRDLSRLSLFWQRFWDSSVSLHPPVNYPGYDDSGCNLPC